MSCCTQCLLSEGPHGVELQAGGRCNYCHHWSENSARYDTPGAWPFFAARIETLRGRYPYDALVGLSGGKDSTHVLCRLVKDYRVKPLGITYDNGFLTDYARANIAATVDRLGVDHIFVKPDPKAFRAFYRATFDRFGDPCIACGMGGYFLALKICQQQHIPLFIHGRSPYQIFRNYRPGSDDVFLQITDSNLLPHDFGRLRTLHERIDQHVSRWLDELFDDRSTRELVREQFFLDPSTLKQDFAPENLAFFLSHPYDEEQIKQYNEREADYVRPADDQVLSHADCAIHDAAAWLFNRIRGVSPVAAEVAVMLRRGELGADRALEIIENASQPARSLEDSIAALAETIGRDPEAIKAHSGKLASAGVCFGSH